MIDKKIYLAEELFEEIPEDPDNVLFKIPPEVCEAQGWAPGDLLNIKIENGSMIINKV
jgi:hypothetical protein